MAPHIEDPSNLWLDKRGTVHMLYHEGSWGGGASSTDWVRYATALLMYTQKAWHPPCVDGGVACSVCRVARGTQITRGSPTNTAYPSAAPPPPLLLARNSCCCGARTERSQRCFLTPRVSPSC